MVLPLRPTHKIWVPHPCTVSSRMGGMYCQRTGCPILAMVSSSLRWVIVCGSKRPPSTSYPTHRHPNPCPRTNKSSSRPKWRDPRILLLLLPLLVLFAILFLFVILTLSVVEGEESPHLSLPLPVYARHPERAQRVEGPPHWPLPVFVRHPVFVCHSDPERSEGEESPHLSLPLLLRCPMSRGPQRACSLG
jgi:hypothetical protein